MSLVEFLSSKGYMYESDEPGFFLRCADATLQYPTWRPAFRRVRKNTRAPFGLIYPRESTDKGAAILAEQIRKSWQDSGYHPEILTLCTSKCDLNCPYCIVGIQEGTQFSFPKIEQIEKTLQLLPVKRVEITGGEPLAERENLEQILQWLMGRVERCDLVTNGLAWDSTFWALLSDCAKNYDLRIRLTLSEGLSHMKMSEFETKILPFALRCPEVKINLNFLPNYDGRGMAGFFRRVSQLELPTHITVSPICLLESQFSGPVAFNMESFIKELDGIIENEDEYLRGVGFFSEHDFWVLVNNPQLSGCRRGKVTLSNQGYGLCHMFLREGRFFTDPLEMAQSSQKVLTKPCLDCKYYPDQCLEAIKSDNCLNVKPGCHRCPVIYTCLLRCPFIFNAKNTDANRIDLQCLGHAFLRVFAIWLYQRNKPYQEIQREIGIVYS